MNFNKHSELEGLHAFLSASKYHWVNYSDGKLEETFNNFLASERGTRLHNYAKEAIELGRKQRGKDTLAIYINDAIGFRMTPEQPLFYSPNCFGTADAIAYYNTKKLLRIHDLKSGVTPASMNQLKVYDALFCLEYGFKPKDISIIDRIYQLNEIMEEEPEADEIEEVMAKIIHFDKLIESIKAGER